MEHRDRFVLSKGHTAPGLYSALAHRGFFPVDDLTTLRHIDSYLQGHPNMNTVPGVDMSTGSLGQGISCAAGMALGLKHQNSSARVHTLLGDGEMQEGQVWEAVCAVIAQHGIACPVERIGINDEFGHSGPAGELLKQFGLCAGHIVEAALNLEI